MNAIAAPEIRISNASLYYDNKWLFKNLEFTLSSGRCTCLLGPSGIGKTSILRLIAGLSSMVTASLISEPLIDKIAYMPQHRTLFPWLTVLENILIGKKLRKERYDSRFYNEAISLLKDMGLGHVINAYPKKLSGGMQQRVALVRTLMEDRPVVLMDEPFAALDAITRFHVQTVSAKILRNRTVLLVTHDPLEALRLGHVIYLLEGYPATLQNPIVLNDDPPREVNQLLLSLQELMLKQLSHAMKVEDR